MKQHAFFVEILAETFALEKTAGSLLQSSFRLSKYEKTVIVRKISREKAKQEEKILRGEIPRFAPANRTP